MKWPVQDIWLCPVNFRAHWILVIVRMSQKTLLLIDPFGNEGYYERKVLRNWRNFLKMRGFDAQKGQWCVQTLQHQKQLDGSSCGVLILRFAVDYLLRGNISEVQTTEEAVRSARLEIACELLECKGNAADYCVICSMLDSDQDHSFIEMVQCDVCQRWAHFKCATYEPELDGNYSCKKCMHH
ncbi:sentrin-specific protease 2-like [Paramormyrops kingsleyae]|uniref:sentrin-specific protease 2-like n=1 Tax=Paramormyrops kingsleyae TaxID=1676925 RepID=UPI003B97320A